jgi:hypothetical protein
MRLDGLLAKKLKKDLILDIFKKIIQVDMASLMFYFYFAHSWETHTKKHIWTSCRLYVHRL